MMDPASCFARVVIKRVGYQMLGSITKEDAYAEGYDSQGEFLAAFSRINKMPVARLDQHVWVVEFELAKADPVLAERVSRNIAREMDS